MHYKTVTETLIALGANRPGPAGEPDATMRAAVAALRDLADGEVSLSRFYQTPAFPPGSGPDYINAAALLPWNGTAPALLAALHRIEEQLGRTREFRWEARIIDLDLVGFGQEIHPDAATQEHWKNLPFDAASTQTPTELILPHPRMAERAFVLVPLAEIAPDWRHPMTGQTVAEMCAALPDASRAEIQPL